MTDNATYYQCDEGFSLAKTGSLWRWQETGAKGWSKPFSSKRLACEDMRREFVTIGLNYVPHKT